MGNMKVEESNINCKIYTALFFMDFTNGELCNL